MLVFDKAQWHIDGGENQEYVLSKFKSVFTFLNEENLLSVEGKEILEIGIDSSVSLNERLVTATGKDFLQSNYDKIINYSPDEIYENIKSLYSVFDQ